MEGETDAVNSNNAGKTDAQVSVSCAGLRSAPRLARARGRLGMAWVARLRGLEARRGLRRGLRAR
jgi:hypothetical protein